jgi:hypothetical protein
MLVRIILYDGKNRMLILVKGDHLSLVHPAVVCGRQTYPLDCQIDCSCKLAIFLPHVCHRCVQP